MLGSGGEKGQACPGVFSVTLAPTIGCRDVKTLLPQNGDLKSNEEVLKSKLTNYVNQTETKTP